MTEITKHGQKLLREQMKTKLVKEKCRVCEEPLLASPNEEEPAHPECE